MRLGSLGVYRSRRPHRRCTAQAASQHREGPRIEIAAPEQHPMTATRGTQHQQHGAAQPQAFSRQIHLFHDSADTGNVQPAIRCQQQPSRRAGALRGHLSQGELCGDREEPHARGHHPVPGQQQLGDIQANGQQIQVCKAPRRWQWTQRQLKAAMGGMRTGRRQLAAGAPQRGHAILPAGFADPDRLALHAP